MLKIFWPWAFFIFISFGQSAFALPPENSPRALVHLLDYLAQDYGGAVKNGKIVSQTEYKEQQEFSEMASQINKNLSETMKHDEIQNDLDSLRKLIAGKTSETEVSALAKKI